MATLTEDQKKSIIDSLKSKGTYKQAALDTHTTREVIYKERKKSSKFATLCEEARFIGQETIADDALFNIRGIAMGEMKPDKTVLTANAMLANAYSPGFKGTTHIEGKIQHNIQVHSSVPRPAFIEGHCTDITPLQIEQPKLSPKDKIRKYQRERMKKIRAEAKLKRQSAPNNSTSLQLVAVG